MMPGGSKFVLVDGEPMALEERVVHYEPEKSVGDGYPLVKSAEVESEESGGYAYRVARPAENEPIKSGGY